MRFVRLTRYDTATRQALTGPNAQIAVNPTNVTMVLGGSTHDYSTIYFTDSPESYEIVVGSVEIVTRKLEGAE